MAFLNKAQVESYASVAHLDLNGLTWQQKQKTINDHMRRNGIKDPIRFIEDQGAPMDPSLDMVEEIADATARRIEELEQQLEEARSNQPIPQVPVVFEKGRNVPQPTIEDYENVVLIASPEQRPTQYQKGKWYENVGTQKDTEEISFDIGKNSPFKDKESGTRNATYRIHDTGRKVEAESTMPKYSALLTFRPTKDLAATAEFNGHKGYLWKHHRLPNVKNLLEQMGAFEEFKEEWQKQRKIFYLAGLECCDIPFTEYMFDKIQRELAKRDGN